MTSTGEGSFNEPAPNKENTVFLFGVGFFLSLVPIFVVVLALYDNPAGFRSAENLTDLLGMMFSALALPWIVIAVLLQRTELALQRRELALQREEIRRLADETNRQAMLMDNQLLLERRASIVTDYKKFLEAEMDRLPNLIGDIIKAVDAIALEKSGLTGDDVQISRRIYRRRTIWVGLTDPSTDTKAEVTIRYTALVSQFRNNPRITRAHGFWKACSQVRLGLWFRWYLPHAIGSVGSLSVHKIVLFNAVAARARRTGH